MFKQPFFVLLALISAAWPSNASAGILGPTDVVTLPVLPFLSGDSAYQTYFDTFNYFFSLEIYCGLIAVWVKMIINVFKR